MSIRAIAFDLDNTLIDRDAAMLRWAATWGCVSSLRKEGLALDERGKGDRGRLGLWFDAVLPKSSSWTGSEIAQQIARHVQIRAEVLEMLTRLEKGYTIGIVSNGGSLSQREKLRRSGLASLVPIVLVSEEFGCAKPDPRIFVEAARLLQCPLEETLFVGDDLVCDIQGASKVGMQTCAVAPSGAIAGADFQIGKIQELEAALQEPCSAELS